MALSYRTPHGDITIYDDASVTPDTIQTYSSAGKGQTRTVPSSTMRLKDIDDAVEAYYQQGIAYSWIEAFVHTTNYKNLETELANRQPPTGPGMSRLEVWLSHGIVPVESSIVGLKGTAEFEDGLGPNWIGKVRPMTLPNLTSEAISTGSQIKRILVHPDDFAILSGLKEESPSDDYPDYKEPVCECGSCKVGILDYEIGHSSWCPVRN